MQRVFCTHGRNPKDCPDLCRLSSLLMLTFVCALLPERHPERRLAGQQRQLREQRTCRSRGIPIRRLDVLLYHECPRPPLRNVLLLLLFLLLILILLIVISFERGWRRRTRRRKARWRRERRDYCPRDDTAAEILPTVPDAGVVRRAIPLSWRLRQSTLDAHAFHRHVLARVQVTCRRKKHALVYQRFFRCVQRFGRSLTRKVVSKEMGLCSHRRLGHQCR